jgi:Alpha/beta hydrolase domain
MARHGVSSLRVAVVLAVGAAVGVPAAANADSAGAGIGSTGSRITAVTVTSTRPIGTFNGAAYVRMVGTVDGVVSSRERVAGIAGVAGSAGTVPYTAQFELVTAAPGQSRSDGVVVEAENRGNPFVLDSLQNFGLLQGSPATIAYPAGFGNGFLQNSGLAWARVQWQGPNGTGAPVNASVPLTAQGVGEVVVRDFGLMLRGLGGSAGTRAGLPTFGTALLVGVSQSAWFVNTFIAEGFNAIPGRLLGRVFQGAYTQDGVGNWLALNQINAARGNPPQSPYVQQNGVPLAPRELLGRPLTDPFLVDTTAYTDFYRVRASVFNSARLPANLREYDLPSAHSSAAGLPAGTPPTAVGCAIGATDVQTLNPLDSRPFTRAAVLGLARRVGVRGLRVDAPSLPPSTRFALTDGPAAPVLDNGDPNLPLFNPLPGVRLKVPVVDANNQPVGGRVRFPDAALTLGTPTPVSVPPVATRSIADTCGNFGGWRPFTASQLAARYGTADLYVAAYAPMLDRLIARGYVLRQDRDGILAFVRSRFGSAPA